MKMKLNVRWMLAAMMLQTAASHAAVKYFSDAGGPLTWNNVQTNWGTVSGGPYTNAVWATYDDAVFEGIGGFVNLNGVTANTVKFNVDGYVLTNSVLNFGNPATYNLTAAAGMTGTVYSTMTVPNAYGTGLRKYGPGTIVLGGSGSSAVYLLIDQGTLGISGGSLTVGTNGFVMGNAGVSTNTPAFSQTGGAVNLTTGSSPSYLGNQTGNGFSTFSISGGTFGLSTISFVAGTRASSAVNISGTGVLTASLLQLGHTASAVARTNTVNLNGGTLAVGSVTLAAATGNFNFNGGTLTPTGTSATFMTGLSSATVRGGGAVIDTTNFNITIGQALLTGGAGNDGGLTKLGSGTLTLSGANTYTGATVISTGTLQIGVGGAAGTLGNNSRVTLPAGSGLTFYRSDQPYAVGNVINGGGTLTLRGTGASAQSSYQFSNNNTGFTGVAYLDNVRLQGTLVNIGKPSMIYIVDNTNDSGQIYGGGSYAVTMGGLGWQEAAGRLGALRLENATWSGPIMLSGHARIGSYASGNSVVSGIISGPYQVEYWCGNGTQTFTISPTNANAYASTEVSLNAVVVAGNTNALSSGPLLMNGGTLRLNGFNFSFSNLASTTSSGTIMNNSGASPAMMTVGADGSSQTYSGTLVDGSTASLSLTKIGAGSLILGGSNTCSGVMIISNGAILVNGFLSTGDVTVVAGALIGGSGVVQGSVYCDGSVAPGTNGPGVLTVSNFFPTVNATTFMELGGSAPGSGYDQLNVGGGVTLAGALTVSNINSFLPNGLSFTLLNVATLSGTFASTNLPPLAGNYAWALSYTATSVVLTAVSTATNNLVWSPTVSADWDSITTNWFDTGLSAASLFTVGDGVLFDDSGAYSNNVNLTETISAQSVTASSSSNYTFSGPGKLSGATVVTKAGSGTLTILTTNNNYAGGTTISNGTLQLGNGGTLGTVGSGPIANGAALVLNSGADDILANAIAGTGSVSLVGGGDVTLAATNSYAGGTTVAAGRLRVASPASIPTGGKVTVASGGECFTSVAGTLTNNFFIAGDGGSGSVFDTQPRGALRLQGTTIAGGGSVTLVADASVGAYSGSNGTINAAIGESGGSRALGVNRSTTATPGTITLGGVNTYSGPTTIGAGTLAIGGSGLLGSGSYAAAITNNGALNFGSTATQTLGGVISGPGSLTMSGSGLLTLTATNSYAGATTVSGGTLNLPAGSSISNASLLLVSGTGGGNLVIEGGSLETSLGSGNAIYVGSAAGQSGVIYLAGGSVLQDSTNATVTLGDFGTGTWNQSGGSATFSSQLWMGNQGTGVGQLNVSNGTLIVSNAVQFGVRNLASMTVNGPSASVSVSGTFSMGYGVSSVGMSYTYVNMLDGAVSIGGNLILGNSFTGGSATSIWTQAGGTTTVAGGVTVGNWGTGYQEMTISGGRFLATNAQLFLAIRGSATYPTTLTITNTGAISLKGLNFGHSGGNATGARVLNLAGDGVLQIGSSGMLWNNGTFTVNLNGGTLQAAANFAWTANTNITALVQAHGLIVDTTNFNVTIGQDLTDAGGGLTKLGIGTLTLNGADSYSGATALSNGALIVNGTLGAGDVTVASGATLGGTGTLSGIVTSSGTVAPGSSAGLLTLLQNYTQTTSGVLALEIGGTTAGADHDQLFVAGSAGLAGALTVSFISGYTGTYGSAYTVLISGVGVSGTFATTNLPALESTNAWNVDYQANYVVLSITSAPSVAATGYDLAALAITNGLTGYQDDADGDGYANLLEYVTGGNLTNADALASMSGTRIGGLLALQFTRTSNSVDTTIIVEGSSSSTNDVNWIGIATNVGGSWGSATNVAETGGPSLFNVTAYDTDPSTNRFLRLRITRP